MNHPRARRRLVAVGGAVLAATLAGVAACGGSGQAPAEVAAGQVTVAPSSSAGISPSAKVSSSASPSAAAPSGRAAEAAAAPVGAQAKSLAASMTAAAKSTASTGAGPAANKNGWGTPVKSQSDEYNATKVNLAKWGLFGAPAEQYDGCTAGFNGNGQRCGSQTTEGNGYLSVTGTSGGKTGGIFGRTTPFRYGRIEIRTRTVMLSGSGSTYHAAALLWPSDGTDYRNSEIDFAEKDVSSGNQNLFAHHDMTQDHCGAAVDSSQWHTFALDWEPGTISWYVDGKLNCTIKASISAYQTTNGGAQLDMFPDTGTTMRAARLDVDYIRMYASSHTQYYK